jgi:class 3 adenylate cyclase
MVTAIVLAVLFAFICLAFFLYAVHVRWFSRMERGFLFTMILAVAGSGILSALLLGTWAADIAREMLFSEIVNELHNVGEVTGANLHQAIKLASTELFEFTDEVSGELSNKDHTRLDALLRQIERLNNRFVQISVFDAQGGLIDTASNQNKVEPVNRIGTAYAVSGKDFVSDPYVSPVFNKFVIYIAVPIRDSQQHVIGAISARYDLQEALSNLISTTRFDGDGYGVIVEDNGRILAHPDSKRINEDISSYPAFQHGRLGEAGWLLAPDKAGLQRLMVYRPLESPATINPKPWVLLTEIDEAKAMAPIRALELRLLLAAIGLTLISLLVAFQIASTIRRPLDHLVQFVGHVQDGELSSRVEVQGHDEVGRLGTALNQMVKGLQERDRIKEVFGRYVTTQVSEKVLKEEVQLGGEMRRVTILFSDIRNFTAMSESMKPAQVVSFLNDYFSEMVEAVFEQQGVLDKFLGDGMMAVFGSMDDMPDHPRRAVLAALRMKALVAKINGDRAMSGHAPITIGIGIHTDDVIVGNIGSRRRLEYTCIGDGVNTSSRVEALNKQFGTTILITETTYEAIQDQFECRLMPDAQIRGKMNALSFYEVLSVKTAALAAHV